MGPCLLDGALHPLHPGEVDSEIILQMAANIDRRRLGIEASADALAFQILRRANARVAIDEDETVAEGARGKNRYRHEGRLSPIHHADEFGTGELCAIKLMVAHHAVEDLARGFDADVVEVDSLGLDFAGAERFRSVITSAGEGERQAIHGRFPLVASFRFSSAS